MGLEKNGTALDHIEGREKKRVVLLKSPVGKTE
jgi:hypothetical protein